MKHNPAKDLQRAVGVWCGMAVVSSSAGGCGKTSTASRLAFLLDRAGLRVWVHDGDPQLHALLRLRGVQQPGEWGKGSWASCGAPPTRADAVRHGLDVIVVDGPGALLLDLPEPADYAIFVVGATKTIPTLWEDANLLAASGQAGRVLVLLNDTDGSYPLSGGLYKVRREWKAPPRSPVELLPHGVAHEYDLRHEVGAAGWDRSYSANREDGVSDVAREIQLLVRYGTIAARNWGVRVAG